MATISMDKINLDRNVKFRMYPPEGDSRMSLFGEEVKVDENGRRYFDCPALPELKQYAKDLFIGWEMTPDFIDVSAISGVIDANT